MLPLMRRAGLLELNNPLNVCKKRNLWAWLNIIFNRVDEDRVQLVGPDQACAEWLLRNGGAVKFMGDAEKSADYNVLIGLHENFTKTRFIEEVDASDCSISHHGFDHFIGCKKIRKITLHNCVYLEDPAISKLQHVQKTLEHLQISACGNVTDDGINMVANLRNLQILILYDLVGVKDMKNCVHKLNLELPTCRVLLKPEL